MTQLKKIKAFILDIDGVLTDGSAMVNSSGAESKSIYFRDVDAVYQARRDGLVVALVTGEKSPMVDVVAQRLEVETVIAGAKDKLAALKQISKQFNIPMTELSYVGDADRDAPALSAVGLGMAPSDASAKAKAAAHKTLSANGGRGAVSEAAEVIKEWNSAAETDRSPSRKPSRNLDLDDAKATIVATLQESIAVKEKTVATMADRMALAAEWITETFRTDHKLLLFGNGGSAADAQHVAAEFVGGFENHNRQPWATIALTTDTSNLTAIANDFGYEKVFARQIDALGRQGDLVIAFSTSGNSPNVIEGIVAAQAKGMRVIGLTGQDGGRMTPLCDLIILVESKRTARIQECHIAICHALCGVVETALTGQEI